jgi:hypothetical protein
MPPELVTVDGEVVAVLSFAKMLSGGNAFKISEIQQG